MKFGGVMINYQHILAVVEMERDKSVANNIFEILDGVKKIGGLDSLKFRYYKNFQSKEATLENLESVPSNADDYKRIKEETTLERM